MRVSLNSYIQLTSDYLYGNISAKCFEYIYLKTFIEEIGEMTGEEYAILNDLFMDVESFCDNPDLIDEDDIGEEELRKRCQAALGKLKDLKAFYESRDKEIT